MEKLQIGIVGGMGSYATVDLFRRIVDAFPAEKEWERPRILIDNYCTMPSRVRAILYNEKREELVEQLVASVSLLMKAGSNRIILGCNTAHVFLDEIMQRLPESKECIVNIIEECGKVLQQNGINSAYLLATEGTIETGIYETILNSYDILVDVPKVEQYEKLRYFIETIKQNKCKNSVMKEFQEFVEKIGNNTVILGCTELPILYEKCMENNIGINKELVDPLQCAIDIIKSVCR